MRASKLLLALLLFWCLCAGCDRSGIPAIKKWTTFSPIGERFTVLMPVKPTSSTMMAGAPGHQFPVYFYTARPSTNYVFSVTHNSFPPDADLSRIFDKTEDQTIKEGAKLISKKDITLHGIPGRELVYEKEGQVISLRLYLVNREIYQAFCVMPEGSADQKFVNEFLNSFQLK